MTNPFESITDLEMADEIQKLREQVSRTLPKTFTYQEFNNYLVNILIDEDPALLADIQYTQEEYIQASLVVLTLHLATRYVEDMLAQWLSEETMAKLIASEVGLRRNLWGSHNRSGLRDLPPMESIPSVAPKLPRKHAKHVLSWLRVWRELDNMQVSALDREAQSSLLMISLLADADRADDIPRYQYVRVQEVTDRYNADKDWLLENILRHASR